MVACGLSPSATDSVKFDVPTAVGVPEMVPVAALKLSPAGRVLAGNSQGMGVCPPVTAIVWL